MAFLSTPGHGSGKGAGSPVLGALEGFSPPPLVSLPASVTLHPAVPGAIVGQLLGASDKRLLRGPHSSDLPSPVSPCHLFVQVGQCLVASAGTSGELRIRTGKVLAFSPLAGLFQRPEPADKICGTFLFLFLCEKATLRFPPDI